MAKVKKGSQKKAKSRLKKKLHWRVKRLRRLRRK